MSTTKVKISLKDINKKEEENFLNITKDCSNDPIPLHFKKLCRKFMKVFINHKERLPLEDIIVLAFSNSSEFDSYKIQINVHFQIQLD